MFSSFVLMSAILSFASLSCFLARSTARVFSTLSPETSASDGAFQSGPAIVEKYRGRWISSDMFRNCSMYGGTSPIDLTLVFHSAIVSVLPGSTGTIVTVGELGVVPSGLRSVSRSTCTATISKRSLASFAASRHHESGTASIGPGPSGSASSTSRSDWPLNTPSMLTAALSNGWAAGMSPDLASSGWRTTSTGLIVERNAWRAASVGAGTAGSLNVAAATGPVPCVLPMPGAGPRATFGVGTAFTSNTSRSATEMAGAARLSGSAAALSLESSALAASFTGSNACAGGRLILSTSTSLGRTNW